MAINRVILEGRLTKEPELRYTPSGVAVATFTLAVNRQFAKDGQQEADFINIVAWRQLAELCANYLTKGQGATLEGRLQQRSYDNKEGKKVYVTEVVADNVSFGPKPNGEGSGNNNSRNNNSGGRGPDPFANDSRTIDISDDDLPF
jgi:single-strand DNA-binding protein